MSTHLLVTPTFLVAGCLSGVVSAADRQPQKPVDFSGWRGIIGPAGMTAAQTGCRKGVFARLVKHPEWQGIPRKKQWASACMNSAETRRHLDAQSRELARTLASLGLSR